MKRHSKLTLFASILIAITAASCGPNTVPTNHKDFLRLNLGAEPSLLNPILSTDSASSSVEGMIFSGLMRVNTELEMAPDLAEKVTISKDGRVYTFRLKKNIRWHDGTAMTAADVKFTFDTILDPKTNTVRRSNYIIDGKKIRFTVIDKYTIRANLPQPFSPFLIHMGMGILPRHLLQGKNINTDPFNRHPIGTGPFTFQDWKSGHHILLNRNSDYFGEMPKLEGILMKIIPDERTALLALAKQEIDEASIPKKDYKKYKNHKGINVFRYEDLLYTYLGFNLEHPLFSDHRIRKAIAHAVNKRAIVNGVLKNFGAPAHIPSSPVSWAYPARSSFPIYSYNPEMSKSLLAEAGFILNPKTELLEKNGAPFKFTLITNKGNKDREKTAQIIQRFLKNIGIEMSIQLMEWSAFIKIVNEPISPKKFDAVILGWSLGLDPDGYAIWHSSQYPRGFNFIGYQNAKVDSLLDQGRRATQKAERKSIYARVYSQIAQDVPYLFLYYPEVLTGINKRIKGLSKPGPAGLMNPIEAVYITSD